MNAVRELKRCLNRLGPFLALLFVYGLFAILGGHRFVNLGTTNDILMLSVIVGVAAVGATLIIISGGIDLSIGCTIAVVTVIVAHLLNVRMPGNPPEPGAAPQLLIQAHPVLWPGVALVLGLLVGAAIGVFIGASVVGRIGRAAAVVIAVCAVCLCVHGGLSPVVAIPAGGVCGIVIWIAADRLLPRVPLPPFIVTLGLWTSLRGTAKWLANGSAVYPEASLVNGKRIWLDSLMSDLHIGSLTLPMPGVWLWLFLAAIMAGILRYTRLGRHIYAVGSNEQTARLCGISVERTRILVYTVGILCGGLAGVLRYSWLGMGDPTTDMGTELLVIASVVIGGASLTGGLGSIGGTVVGTLIIMIVYKGCTVLGLPNFVQEIVTGAIIVAAVVLDQLRHRAPA